MVVAYFALKIRRPQRYINAEWRKAKGVIGQYNRVFKRPDLNNPKILTKEEVFLELI